MHRTLQKCHCEPVTDVTGVAIRSFLCTAPLVTRGNGFPRRFAPRNDIFTKIILSCEGAGFYPARLRRIPNHASVGGGVLYDPQAALFGRKSRRNFRQLHSYLFAAMWMLRCDKRGLSPEKISNTVTFRRSSAAAQGDAGPSAGGSSLFWRAFFRAHRPCDHGSQKGESKLLWQKN